MLLLFFMEHPGHSALCFDISVELSPFAFKSVFWFRSGPITLQEIKYPDLGVVRTGDTTRKFILITISVPHQKNFYIKKSRLDIQQRTFPRVGAKIWNEIAVSLIKRVPKKTLQKETPLFSC